MQKRASCLDKKEQRLQDDTNCQWHDGHMQYIGGWQVTYPQMTCLCSSVCNSDSDCVQVKVLVYTVDLLFCLLPVWKTIVLSSCLNDSLYFNLGVYFFTGTAPVKGKENTLTSEFEVCPCDHWYQTSSLNNVETEALWQRIRENMSSVFLNHREENRKLLHLA